MNPNAGYWNTGIADVPRMTGTSPAVMDCNEVRAICAQMGIALPFRSVLDVGCGTGRCSQLAAEVYVGVDISPSAVAYGKERGLNVSLIDGPESLAAFPDDGFEWVLGWSLFTHIGRDEQQRYLAQFARLAPNLLIDILPGDRGRSAARWGTDENLFRQDLAAAGYTLGPLTPDLVDRSCMARHRYFWGTRPERVHEQGIAPADDGGEPITEGDVP